ncbi:MAG: 2-C-methyl-D-erythritol 4-phosphate cytidylyltransferase [Methylococcales bacterium]|nr:2-C-methyl-D-erythritol 4-phosphate cytidylyltransferase [Methylococcales bacterium]
MNQIKYYAIVPAAGVGQRMQADKPKQYLPLLGKTVIEQTLTRLLKTNIFAKITVALSEDDPYWKSLKMAKHEKIIRAKGGEERADSVLSALQTLNDQAHDDDWVLVHDAARPCVSVDEIQRLISALKDERYGGILALPSHDTLKQVKNNTIEKSVDRGTIWKALTPQMFRYGVLKNALEQTEGDPRITDEASAVELCGKQVKIVEGSSENIKITRPEDLALAEFYLERQCD